MKINEQVTLWLQNVNGFQYIFGSNNTVMRSSNGYEWTIIYQEACNE